LGAYESKDEGAKNKDLVGKRHFAIPLYQRSTRRAGCFYVKMIINLNNLEISVRQFFCSISPVIAYSPRYAEGYSGLPGLQTKIVQDVKERITS